MSVVLPIVTKMYVNDRTTWLFVCPTGSKKNLSYFFFKVHLIYGNQPSSSFMSSEALKHSRRHKNAPHFSLLSDSVNDHLVTFLKFSAAGRYFIR